MGNINAITYKVVYGLIFYNKLFLGKTKVNRFYTPTKEIKVVACYWYTNIKIKKKIPFLKLTKKYNPDEYPKYGNYDAINVNKVKDIPYDYDGVMGIPISFLEKYNFNQFEVIGISNGGAGQKFGVSANLSDEEYKILLHENKGFRRGMVFYRDKNNKMIIPYIRILIRKKKIIFKIILIQIK